MLTKLINEISIYKGIPVEQITKDSNLILELGITSMELFEILFQFEQELNFDEQDLEMFAAETVGELADVLEKLKN